MAVINTRWRVFETFNIWRNHLQASPYDGVATGMTAYFGKGSPPFHSFCTLQQDEEKIIQYFQFPLHYNINNYISRHVGDERKWCRSFQRITVHPGAHSQGGGKLMQIWLLWKWAMCAKTLICSLFQNTFHRLYSQDDGMGVMAEYLTEGESNVFYAPFHSWGASIIKIWFNSRWWPVHAGFRMEQACCNCTSSWYWYRGPISKVFSIYVKFVYVS